jgi:hypothetical protein
MKTGFSISLLAAGVLFGCASEPTHYDKENIRQVILENLKPVRACYETSLKENPALNGKLVAAWTIVEDGHVENVKLISTSMPKDASVHDCILKLISSLRFVPPAPKEVVDVGAYPFFFSN